VATISDVSDLTNLKKLDCSYTEITDVSMLKNLEGLWCGNNVEKPEHI